MNIWPSINIGNFLKKPIIINNLINNLIKNLIKT